jgi:hypothetical protein
MSSGDKLPCDVAAHKSGSAGNERLHQETRPLDRPVNFSPGDLVNRRECAAFFRNEWEAFPLQAAQR